MASAAQSAPQCTPKMEHDSLDAGHATMTSAWRASIEAAPPAATAFLRVRAKPATEGASLWCP